MNRFAHRLNNFAMSMAALFAAGREGASQRRPCRVEGGVLPGMLRLERTFNRMDFHYFVRLRVAAAEKAALIGGSTRFTQVEIVLQLRMRAHVQKQTVALG